MVEVDTLRQTALFSGIDVPQLKKILPSCTIVKTPAGGSIFEVGDAADTLYVLLEGAVTITFPADGLGNVDLSEVEVGRSFGWSSLVAPNKYTTNAQCQADSKILAVRSDGIRELMREDPGTVFHIMQNLIATLQSRLKDTRVQLFEALATVERLKQGDSGS